jgi:hypothetical protein
MFSVGENLNLWTKCNGHHNFLNRRVRELIFCRREPGRQTQLRKQGAFQITSRKHHYKKQRTSLHQIPQVRQIKKSIENRRNAGMENSGSRKYDTHHCPGTVGGFPPKSSAASAVFLERFTHDTCAVLRLAHLCFVGNTVSSQMI